MGRPLDALFVPFYSDIDRWHNDGDGDWLPPSLSRSRALLAALSDERFLKDEVDLVIDGQLYDFSRFLSWVAHDTTEERDRYDPFSMTLLAGSYYASLFHRHGIEARVLNVGDRRSFAAAAERWQPRIVFLSTTLLFDAFENDLVTQAVARIRQTWPDAVVVLGGLMLVSYRNNLPRDVFFELLRTYGADAYVVSAQGELPTLEILRRGSREALQEPPGIPCTYLLVDGEVREPSTRIDGGLPLQEGWVRWSRVAEVSPLYHTVHMRTARSCAFACAFCEYPVNQGPLTLMPVEVVDRELTELASLGTVRSLIFTDDTFNVPLRRFKELLRVLARHDFEWYSFFRPQYADEETARLMKEANCRAVFAGLEAADDQMLVNMRKKAKVDEYKRGLEQLREQDIEVHANFIVGFPGETERSARAITRFVDDLGLKLITVVPWIFLPSTPIGAETERWGIEGMGVSWRHRTMDSTQAQALAAEVVAEQRSAVQNAVRGEAWTEFLLYANGWNIDEVRLAISTFNRYLGRDVAGEEIRGSREHARLAAVLERHPMPKPPNLGQPSEFSSGSGTACGRGVPR